MPGKQDICIDYQECLNYDRKSHMCNEGRGFSKQKEPCARKKTVREWHKEFKEKHKR